LKQFIGNCPIKKINNCKIIIKAVRDGHGYPDVNNNKCEGYCKSYTDDKPLEECKNCRYFELYAVD
jgi:hypothetical protein